MDTIKAANKIIKEGIILLPDEAKGDFKAQASDIFVDEAIANAMEICDEAEKLAEKGDDNTRYRARKEKEAILRAYSVQEANRVVTMLWRMELLTPELEKEYRALPKMEDMAKEYNEFTSDRKARMDKVMADHRAIAEEEKELDIFKGIINGVPAAESEKRYEEYKQQQQAAMAGVR